MRCARQTTSAGCQATSCHLVGGYACLALVEDHTSGGLQRRFEPGSRRKGSVGQVLSPLLMCSRPAGHSNVLCSRAVATVCVLLSQWRAAPAGVERGRRIDACLRRPPRHQRRHVCATISPPGSPEHVCYVEAIKPPSNDALFTRAFVYLQDRKRSGGKEARGTQVGAQGREEGRQSEAARSVPAAAAAQVRAALRHQCMPFQLACKRDTWKFTWSVARRLASSSGLWHRRGAKAEAKTMKDESSDDEEELSES